MADKIKREKVQNPFSMGPNTQFQEPARQMKQMINKPRAAFQKSNQGLEIVDSLLRFAEVGGGIYKTKISDKIAEDKVVQAALADANLAPSDDATVAGYRAHAAVMLQDRVFKDQLELNKLAKENLSQEEWDTIVREKYQGTVKYLKDNYSTYDDDKEMQRLVPLSFREMMPQVRQVRKAEHLKQVTEKGKNSVTDYLINQAKFMQEEGVSLPPEQLSNTFDFRLKALKLTSKEKDDVIEQAILTSKSPALLEAAKKWTGDRKASLFDRSAKLQTLEKKLKNEKLSTNAVAMATKLTAIKQGIITGEITMSDGLGMLDKMNKETDGSAASKGFISSIWTDYYNARAAEAELTRDKAAFTDPNSIADGSMSSKRKKAAIRSIYQDEMDRIDEAVKDLPEDQKYQQAAVLKKQAQARVADMAVKNNETVTPFVNALHNLATSNIAFRAEKDESGLPVLGNTEKEGIALIEAMSPIALIQHLEDLGGRGKEARVIRDFLAYRDRGLTEPQALAQAQANFRNLPIADSKRIAAGVAEVRDNLEFLLRPDFEDKQVPYLEEQIRNQIALSSEPDSDTNIKLVSEYFKKGWTQAGDLWIKGSQQYLAQQLGVEGSMKGRAAGANGWIKDAFDAYQWGTQEEWEPMLAGNGLEADDVFPEVDNKKGTVRMVARNKAFRANMYLTKPIPLSEVTSFMAKKKEHDQKLAAEKYEETEAELKRYYKARGVDDYL
jgi:hypothetical protein